jgi:hypothetical protein
LPVRQQIGVFDDITGARADRVGHAIAGTAAGAQLLVDDVLAHQPAQDRPGTRFVHWQGGEARNENVLGIHAGAQAYANGQDNPLPTQVKR